MSVPTPRGAERRTVPGPPAGPVYLRRAGVAAAALCLIAATAAAAPPAPAAPTGCGDLTGGQLCLRGPVGAAGRYVASYRRGGAAGPGEITVRLGYQRKDVRITAFPGWFGFRRTVRGAAELGGRVEMLPGECIRGLMEHRDTVFVTKWSCG
ncbi:hypothetical protein [Streptomyces pinistramenti]|uniref:hypothetical protein n=1 Tax=Streptomyces pinistramenti TaxID=2884812 RepID=UPI001D061157|nr:hypothetical protein [Streptomyces pinistramenti]MCB5911144.1 hypothetical protein [Streptomyces pinistramenti]